MIAADLPESEDTQSSPESLVVAASFAQQRMWFLDRLDASHGTYNVPFLTRLRGPFHADGLEFALSALVERHESLRTVFTLVDGVPHQVIRPAAPAPLDVVDLTGAPDAETRGLQLIADAARASFDLENDLPLRAVLVTLGADDHLLAVTLHHIVTDGWSMSVLTRELGELYEAFGAGRTANLPELPIQYADYAAWQQQWMESGGLEQQLDYWKRTLVGAPALLELPTDKPRRAEQSFRGATLDETFPPALLDGLRALGDAEGATLFMTLLAAFTVLLSRYSGQDDIVVGTPVANRNRSELEGVIGLLVNTLALRTDVSDNPTFRELVRRVREVSLDAFSHQDLPFEKVIAELNPERSPGHAPVTQVLFALQGSVGEPMRLEGVEQERIRSERGTAKFDLSLLAGRVSGGLRVAIEYCSDLFTEPTIRQMLGHYRALLDSAIADPDRPIDQLPLMDEADASALLTRLANDGQAFPEFCLHERFEEQVHRSPDAPAVTYDGRSLSYATLNERANRLAHRLQSEGVGAQTLVALCLERSLELPVAILAVLKAGGAYVPLDPEHPAERIAFVLEDCRAPVLITQESLLERLPTHAATVLCVDRDGAELERESATDLGPVATPESLAYVIYTSGSTGRPKGVLVEHRHVARLFTATEAWFSFSERDTWSLLHSYAFDFSVWELWGALLHGGRLIIVPRATARSPEALAALLAGERVTVLNATPSLFLTAMDELCAAADSLSLRLVVFGGEALQTRLLAPWYGRFGDDGPLLVNMYGITETTVHVTYRPLQRRDSEHDSSPIGVPVPDLQLYLLDPHMAPVPDGVAGELYVGGAGVARGYLNRTQLTAERFLPNPFGPGRLYRTGDRARWRRGSGLAFEGRLDDQVKIRGFRIELGEIQAALAEHEQVAECAVVTHAVAPGDLRLAAYVVPLTGAQNGALSSQLRDWLRGKLPDYMVPASFTAIAEIPLTANGKLDRRALPEPNAAAQHADLVAPSGELELALAQIWTEHLHLAQVGVDEDFFALGGHSLLAVAVAHAIHEQLQRTCTVAMLFRNRTIRALAAELHAGGADATEPTILQLSPGSGPPLFCICGVHAFQELAEELGTDSPVFGIFLPVEQELLGRPLRRRGPDLSVPELAARYVAVVRTHQPQGPYMLLGFCLGGVLAYEAARQLRADGEEVSIVVMLDSSLRSVMKARRRLPLRRRIRRAAVRHYRYLPRPAQDLLIGPQWRDERKRVELLRLRIYTDAGLRYEVGSYDGSVVLVRPQTTADALAARGANAMWGWNRYVSDLAVCDVPGDHLSHLNRPHVRALAQAIRPHLERAVAEPPARIPGR